MTYGQGRGKASADGHIFQFSRFQMDNHVISDIRQNRRCVWEESAWIEGGQFMDDLSPTWCELGTNKRESSAYLVQGHLLSDRCIFDILEKKLKNFFWWAECDVVVKK